MSSQRGPSSESRGPIPVLQTSATRNEGISELAEAIAAAGRRKRPDPKARLRRLLQALALDRLRRGMAELPDAELDALAEAVLSGQADIETTLHQLTSRFTRS